MIKRIVADAGLLLPEAGTVDLDKFKVDLWITHTPEECSARLSRAEITPDMFYGAGGIHCRNRSADVGAALHYFSVCNQDVTKDEILFLSRRVGFVGKFTQGQGTTCGEWTRPVDAKGHKGFFKANPAIGVCPVQCDFCYLRGVPYSVNSLALNVGEYAEQITSKRRVRGRSVLPKIINLSETGGPIEWAVEYGLQEWVQAITDATLEARVIPYWLTKKAIYGLNLGRAHVGISLNPRGIMKEHSPFADHSTSLLSFLRTTRRQGASTVIRWGPVMAGFENEYDDLAYQVNEMGLGTGRFTVDLLRYSARHPAVPKEGFEFRAHKWQESPEVQRAHLQRVRDYFPRAHITCCKVQPSVAIDWVREKLIQSFPCACWV